MEKLKVAIIGQSQVSLVLNSGSQIYHITGSSLGTKGMKAINEASSSCTIEPVHVTRRCS